MKKDMLRKKGLAGGEKRTCRVDACENCKKLMVLDEKTKGIIWVEGTMHEDPWHSGRPFYLHVQGCKEVEDKSAPQIFGCPLCERFIYRHPPGEPDKKHYKIMDEEMICLKCWEEYELDNFVMEEDNRPPKEARVEKVTNDNLKLTRHGWVLDCEPGTVQEERVGQNELHNNLEFISLAQKTGVCYNCLKTVELDRSVQGETWNYGCIHEDPWQEGRCFFIHRTGCEKAKDRIGPRAFICRACKRIVYLHKAGHPEEEYFKDWGVDKICLRCWEMTQNKEKKAGPNNEKEEIEIKEIDMRAEKEATTEAPARKFNELSARVQELGRQSIMEVWFAALKEGYFVSENFMNVIYRNLKRRNKWWDLVRSQCAEDLDRVANARGVYFSPRGNIIYIYEVK